MAREGFSAYRSSFGLLLLTALAVFALVGLVETASAGLEDLDADDLGGIEIAGALAAILGVTLTATLGDVFYTGVVAAVVAETSTGARHQLADIVRRLPYGRLIAVDLLFTLLVAAGLIALVVPGILAFTWFALAAPVVKTEGLGVRAAFRRSRELVRGSFWRLLALLAPVIVAGDAVAELLSESGVRFLGEGFTGHLLGTIFAEALTAPFFALAAVVATHQLIELKR